jgi:large subunit ribosomal protein L28
MDFEHIAAPSQVVVPSRGFRGAVLTSPLISNQEGFLTMAAVCDICGKHPGFGMSVSFSHKRNPRRWNPNVQRIRILEGRRPVRRNVCTSCIKANKVQRAV